MSTGISDRARGRITTAIVSTSLAFVLTIITLLIVEPPRHDTDSTPVSTTR